MRCSEIIEILEQLSPRKFACSWDNVGLLVGSEDADIKNILVALDGDDAAVDKAIELGSDLIITHHPLIFGAIENVTSNTLTGARIMKLIKNNISCYTMHTNFDAKGGMAELAADMIGIKDGEVLEFVCEKEGFGRIGSCLEMLTVKQWASKVKDLFELPNVCVYGDLNQNISRVAIAPGSGKDYVSISIEKGAQLLISGDINYHSGIDAVAQGMAIIDAGHYGIEHIFIKYISEYLKTKLSSKDNQNIHIEEMKKKLPFEII